MKNKMMKALKKAIKDLPEDKQEKFMKEFENVGKQEKEMGEAGKGNSGEG